MEKRRIGLALGSGAARGFAHIGVLQVLKENNIDIHMVAGSSMGALIGALYCCGIPVDMLGKMAVALGNKPIFDYTIPRMGFIKGERVNSIMKLLTKNRDFDQLDIPLSVVAADLITCRPVVIDTGKVYEAVRASISIPGIFVPVTKGEMVLVDGGVVDRVPVSVVSSMGADFIIAVDVGFNGTHSRPKNIMEVYIQAMEVMEMELVRGKLIKADVLIRPDVSRIGLNRFDMAEKCIELGRQAAKEAMPALQEMLDRPLLGRGEQGNRAGQ
ncbi:MAG: patatin-like phospholipase family protein [Mahellales bacterium]|jgi:NTE family protein